MPFNDNNNNKSELKLILNQKRTKVSFNLIFIQFIPTFVTKRLQSEGVVQ